MKKKTKTSCENLSVTRQKFIILISNTKSMVWLLNKVCDELTIWCLHNAIVFQRHFQNLLARLFRTDLRNDRTINRTKTICPDIQSRGIRNRKNIRNVDVLNIPPHPEITGLCSKIIRQHGEILYTNAWCWIG